MGGVVDLSTGKIIGCKKNSLPWFHEVGHLQYHKSEKGIKNSYRQDLALKYSIVFIFAALFIDFFKWIAGIFLLIYFGYELYEEKWCWDFAQKEFKEFKKPQKLR